MKPYYRDVDVTLYHGDCRDVLPGLDPESVDLLLTDPPYGAGWAGTRNDADRRTVFGPIAGDAGGLDVPAVLATATRALRTRRHAYVFGRWTLADPRASATAELVWDKCIPGPPAPGPWQYQHEYITFFVRLIHKSEARADYGGAAVRLRRGSVLRFPRPNGQGVRHHPTEKPVALLRELIEASSRSGETVLDPFAGSGSTLVAAKLEGRRSIGIEVEERYCEVAARRLAQQSLPINDQAEHHFPVGAEQGAPRLLPGDHER